MQVRIEVDPREVFAGFDRMAKQSRTLGRAFQLIKPEMRADQKDHASHQAGPDGPWPARASSTSAKHARSGRRYLGRRRRKRTARPLGRLLTTVSYMASNAGVFGTSPITWSGVHQQGGKVGRGAVVPARPFLWLSDRLVGRATTLLERTLVRSFEGQT